jgi:hypothetical protein
VLDGSWANATEGGSFVALLFLPPVDSELPEPERHIVDKCSPE